MPKKKNIFIGIGIVFLFAVLFFLNSFDYISPIKGFFANIVYPISNIFTGISFGISDFFQENSSDCLKENANLKAENEKLQTENLQFNLLKKENEDLRNELKLFQEDKITRIFVQVVGVSPSNQMKEIIINKGSQDGVKKDDILVKNGIFFGRVSEVFKNFSKVRLVFDNQFREEVYILRTKENGLFIGGENPRVEFPSKDADVKEGDLILLYSPQIVQTYVLVGSVKKIEVNDILPGKKCYIELAVKQKDLDNLFILK